MRLSDGHLVRIPHGPILILILRAPKIEQFFQLMTTKTSRKQVLQT